MLDRIGQRLELINILIKESYEFTCLTAEDEDDNDWAGAKVTFDYLVAFERLIRAEEIFLNTFYAMEDTRCSYRDTKGHFLMIFLSDGLNAFVHEILLPDLEYTLKVLSEWGFKTTGGEEFKNYLCEQLERLIKKYQDLYKI